MRNLNHKFLTIILPAIILTPLLWLMAGCIYVPWFEHRTDSGPNIRALIGPENSTRIIRPYHVERAEIVKILGTPKYTSFDGTAIAYQTTTRRANWVWPLCFSSFPADDKAYMVRLVFDKSDQLRTIEWAEGEETHDWLNTFNPIDTMPILKLNRTEPKLHYIGPDPSAP